MNASWEPTAGIVRLHPAGGRFGSPFDLAVSVSGDEGVATIKALCEPMTPRRKAAIFDCLREAGFHAVRWTRHRANGTVQEVRHTLKETPHAD